MASRNFLLVSKRAYTVASGNIAKLGSSSMKNKVIEGIRDEKPEKKKVFWMRHPKTGYYMPETHFDEVEVADTDVANKIVGDTPKR